VICCRDAVAAMRSLRSDRHLLSVPGGFIGMSQAVGSFRCRAEYSGTRFHAVMERCRGDNPEDIQYRTAGRLPSRTSGIITRARTQKSCCARQRITWNGNFDPRDSLARLKIPGLWVLWWRDRNVNVDLSIERLEMLRLLAPNYSYRVLSDYDHQLGGIIRT